MTWDSRRWGRVVGPVAVVAGAATAVALFVLPSCGREPESAKPPTATPTPQPTPTPTPTTAPAAVSPFTGRPGRTAPVLAVKIDNVGPARPHTGLAAADLVYVEQVEGGQSRILAVFSSREPPEVGPVRSARQSDLELLRQFGRPALAYSGAQTALKPLIRAAPLYPLPPETAPRAYTRAPSRPAPHNLYLNPRAALAAAPRASIAKDIGFRFGPAPAGGRQVNEQTVRYPAARFTFTWSGTGHHWLVSMDGASARSTDAGRLTASTVVVQHVMVHPSRFKDRLGAVSPYTETVGSGSALVLRDGKGYDARWSRPTAESGTSFTTAAGRLNFAPGQTWIVFTGS
ncbi:DUF3048 domain-containing protein [Streptomyces sp. NBC_00190]|uniref:DUF3048 domain-containing protein n=1 Tax=unclassified Streptomyces TaxID=2593676 RepID=UPI002E2AB016|nr:DUF3048 domain-containing protein [Streptomyces sp. NBC_00190]WSZ44615.1 DUF3048 domain-containing protein [Streptomyces sp. NBC_00868]